MNVVVLNGQLTLITEQIVIDIKPKPIMCAGDPLGATQLASGGTGSVSIVFDGDKACRLAAGLDDHDDPDVVVQIDSDLNEANWDHSGTGDNWDRDSGGDDISPGPFSTTITHKSTGNRFSLEFSVQVTGGDPVTLTVSDVVTTPIP